MKALGPDPLIDGIDPVELQGRLSRSRTPIKVAIMDQGLLPGVGNIQASEALFRAGIDPRRPARSLSSGEVARLAEAILASIAFTLASFAKAGVDGGGADIVYIEEDRTSNPFLVYGRAGEPCPGAARGSARRARGLATPKARDRAAGHLQLPGSCRPSGRRSSVRAANISKVAKGSAPTSLRVGNPPCSRR